MDLSHIETHRESGSNKRLICRLCNTNIVVLASWVGYENFARNFRRQHSECTQENPLTNEESRWLRAALV